MGVIAGRTAHPTLPVTRFELTLPQEALQGFSISPDGRTLAYSALLNDRPIIWLKDLASRSPALPRIGSEDGRFPFWSPDSKSIAFFAEDKLKRIDVQGTDIRVVCRIDCCEAAVLPRGTAWNADGDILFAVNGLRRVAASGGTPQLLAAPDEKNEVSYGWPFFLPGGRRFLYYAESKDRVHRVYATSLDDARQRVLVAKMNVSPVYVPQSGGRSGYLLYSREGNLVAQRFDSEHLRLSGEPTLLADQVAHATALRIGGFGVS